MNPRIDPVHTLEKLFRGLGMKKGAVEKVPKESEQETVLEVWVIQKDQAANGIFRKESMTVVMPVGGKTVRKKTTLSKHPALPPHGKDQD